MEEITTIISSVGFPIVACGIMFIQQKELNQAITKLSFTLESINQRIVDIERSIKE